MDDETLDSTPPELRVLLDLELTVESANAPAGHQKLQEALVDAPGVKSVSFPEDKIAILYDPEQITKARLSELIGSAGFSISSSALAPPAPPVDSQG